MKRLLIRGGVALVIAVGAFVLLGGGKGFDLLQRLKYPDYYAWRDSGGRFPEGQFRTGFNTDRRRRQLFIGRTREDIQRHFPLLAPVPSDDFLLINHIAERKLPPSRFAWIKGSIWLLEFDADERCTDLFLAKA